MRKYTLTTAGDLLHGDTFLKQDDPHEVIYTVMELPCHISGKLYVRKGSLMATDIMSKKQSVIFLKHKII